MKGRIVVGAVLVVLGIALLVDRLELWDLGAVLATWWPTILILVGALQLATRSATPSVGVVLVIIGALLQAWTLGALPENFLTWFWPAALILVGIWLLVARRRRPARHLVTEDRIDHFVMFGGLETRNQSKHFQGGSVTAVLGGAEIDLRDAELAKEGAKLDFTTLMGGIELKVPEEWKVTVSGTPIFGGLENNAKHREQAGSNEPALEVNCFALMGGVEVHN